MGLRHRAAHARRRPHRRRAHDRHEPLSGARPRRYQAVGQRRLHLLPGRQPAGRAGAGAPQLLVGLCRDGRVPPGRWRRQGAGRVDDPRRAGGGHLRHGRGSLRPVCREPRVHPPDDRPVLLAPLRDDLPQRAAVGGPPAEDGAGVRRDDRGRGALGGVVGSGGADLLHRSRVRGDPVVAPLQRLRHRGRGVPPGAQRGRHPRYHRLLPVRGDRTVGTGMARSAPGRPAPGSGPRQAGADARPRRPAQGRPHRVQLGRWHLVDHGVLLPARLAHALVRRPPGGRRRRA